MLWAWCSDKRLAVLPKVGSGRSSGRGVILICCPPVPMQPLSAPQILPILLCNFQANCDCSNTAWIAQSCKFVSDQLLLLFCSHLLPVEALANTTPHTHNNVCITLIVTQQGSKQLPASGADSEQQQQQQQRRRRHFACTPHSQPTNQPTQLASMPPSLARPFAGLESVDFTGLRLRLVDAENQVCVRVVLSAVLSCCWWLAHQGVSDSLHLCYCCLACTDYWAAGSAAEPGAPGQGQAHLCAQQGLWRRVHRGQR